MLDDGDGLSGQDGLVNTEGGRVDLDQTEVSRDLVSNGNLQYITRNNVDSLNLLDAILVRSDYFASLRLVFF